MNGCHGDQQLGKERGNGRGGQTGGNGALNRSREMSVLCLWRFRVVVLLGRCSYSGPFYGILERYRCIYGTISHKDEG